MNNFVVRFAKLDDQIYSFTKMPVRRAGQAYPVIMIRVMVQAKPGTKQFTKLADLDLKTASGKTCRQLLDAAIDALAASQTCNY